MGFWFKNVDVFGALTGQLRFFAPISQTWFNNGSNDGVIMVQKAGALTVQFWFVSMKVGAI